MALNIENKKAIVDRVAKIASNAIASVAAEYRGLTVAQMTKLRVDARAAGVYLQVVRNTLARRALENTEFACMQESLTGPLILGFSNHEPGAVARLFRDFSKNNEKFIVKVLALSGRLYAARDLEAIATLPTRDEALASLLAIMKAPITKLVRTMAEPHAKLVRTFAAVRDKKEAA